MYKLLIVDDEEFEREGMAQLIDWEKYEIEMAGTAWNGVDAYEKVCRLQPDMILTDIKMPVMNGIELIRKVRGTYPDIEFAVLSGYGEYEFTSQAMELGVRHYILKPCDEDRIVEVFDKVKRDVDARREAARREKDYVNRVIPRAKKQLFRDQLLNRETGNAETLIPLQKGETPPKVRLFAVRSREAFDGLEEFVLGNMLEELLGGGSPQNGTANVYVSTVVRNDAVFLIPDMQPETLVLAARRIEREAKKIRQEPVRAAVSKSGDIGELAGLYQQTEELFRVGEAMKGEPLLHYGMFDGKKQDMDNLVDFDIVGKTGDYALLLGSLQLTFLRMQKRGFSFSEKKSGMDWLLRLLYGAGLETDESCEEDGSGQSLMVLSARQIYLRFVGEAANDKDSVRYRTILEEIYRCFQDQRLCLHYLAAEVLYMNEDYLGRFFQKMSGKRFTRFLLDERINAAKQLMRLEPDIMVCTVSELVGYAADGQYFSRSFRKCTGMTPSEYREKMQRESR